MKRTSRQPSKLSNSLHRQVNSYALAASAAGVGFLALAHPAEAKIVYTRVHHVIGKHGHFGIDFNHDRIVDVTLNNSTFRGNFGASFNVIGGFPNQGESAGAECVSGGPPGTFLEAAVKKGSRIGYGVPFCQRGLMIIQCAHGTHSSQPPCSYHPYGTSGQWANVKNRYLGITFAIHGKTHYGWARLSVEVSRKPFKATAILTGYAYETIPGKPIIAGKMEGPEENSLDEANPSSLNEPMLQPASLGLLAMGSPALSIWRREESVEGNYFSI